MDTATEYEVSFLEILKRLWSKRFVIFLSVISGCVFAAVAWVTVPVTTGATYRMTIYPDGAVLYTTGAIRTQLSESLTAAGFTPTSARDGSVNVTVTGDADGTQIVATVLALTTSIHASIRRAAESGGSNCRELCVRLDAWADAHEAEMFELIAVSVIPYRKDQRAGFALLSFFLPVFAVVILALIAPALRNAFHDIRLSTMKNTPS